MTPGELYLYNKPAQQHKSQLPLGFVSLPDKSPVLVIACVGPIAAVLDADGGVWRVPSTYLGVCR